MIRKKSIANLIFTLMVSLTLVVIATVTVFATGEGSDILVEETSGYVETIYEETRPGTIYEETQPEYVQETEYIEETSAPETYYDIYYEELPQVASEEVVEATTVVIPAVEVTETSLIGGVIAWLCVAVGIAVIAGVLVSQRTRQTSSKHRR